MVGRLHEGDAIWGFETEIPDRKPANLGEAGGTHGMDFSAGRRDGARPVRWLPRGPDTDGSLGSLPWFDRAAVSPGTPPERGAQG